MKKLYGLMGLTGFIMMVGGAGGADAVSFGEALGVMTIGLSLLLLSLALVKFHNMRMRKRRQLYMKRKAAYCRNTAAECVTLHRRTPAGITEIISGKRNSPELC